MSASIRLDAPSGGVPMAITVGSERIVAIDQVVDLVVDHQPRGALEAYEISRPRRAGTPGGLGVEGLVAGTPLRAIWRAIRVGRGPVWELRLELHNEGHEPVSVTRMDPLHAELLGEGWTAHWFRSDWCEEYRPITISTAEPLRLDVRSGRSANGAAPWLGVEREGGGLVISPAWSGNWHIDVMDRGHVTAGIADWRLEVVLGPGESVVAPSVLVAAGTTLDAAACALTAAVDEAWLPRSPEAELLGVEWNHWVPYEDSQIDEPVFLENSALAASMGVRYATVDAGWFGPAEDPHWVGVRGDWDIVNMRRFPDGLESLGDRIRVAGALPGIWLDVEAVGVRARLRSERPEILALSDGRGRDRAYRPSSESVDPQDPRFLGYVCLGSPRGREFVSQTLEHVIGAIGARWLKIDFNVDPDAGCNRTDHGHGAGDGLFRHYEGLYQVLDALRRRHPELIIEACSSGGLRIDLGLARYVDTFFLSDPDYLEHHAQVLWGASLMLPPRAMFHWTWSTPLSRFLPEQILDPDALTDDEFATTVRSTMLHRFGLSLRLPSLPARHRDTVARLTKLYHELMADFVRRGQFLRLTPQPLRRRRGERSPAFQITHDDRAVVLVLRLDPENTASPPGIRPVLPDPGRRYRVQELDSDNDPFIIGAGDTLPAPTQPGRFASRLFLLEPQPDAEDETRQAGPQDPTSTPRSEHR